MEVETTFVITGIVSNPGCDPEKIISLQEAIDRGIIDPNRGLYINKSTYASIAISQAMNEGLIKVRSKRPCHCTNDKMAKHSCNFNME